MKLYVVVVIALCIVSAFAQDNNFYGSVREVLHLYKECSGAEELSPCLKLKALSLIDRVSRMEKISLMDGIVITGKTEKKPNEPTLEEEEKNLPRSLDAKSKILTNMIFNRIARAIGSKSIEISVPKLVESARKKDEEDSKFGDISELLGDKFGGGGEKGGKMKMKDKKKGGDDMKDFLMQLMAHKLAMLPLLIGGLFILAVKALTEAKIALLITGIIFAKKLLASKNQGGGGGGHQVEHVHASTGSAGGWNGGSGGGWSGGWDKRSFEEAQNLAYKAQKQA